MQQLLHLEIQALVVRGQQRPVQHLAEVGVVRGDDVVHAARAGDGLLEVRPARLQHLEHQEGAEVVDDVHHHRAVEVAAVEHGPQCGGNADAVGVGEHGVLLPGGGQAPLHALQPPQHVEGDAVLGDAVRVHDLQDKKYVQKVSFIWTNASNRGRIMAIYIQFYKKTKLTALRGASIE